MRRFPPIRGIDASGLQSRLVKTYNQQEKNNIFMTIAGEGLLVPVTFPQQSGPRPGPKFMVYRKLSEVVKPPDDVV